MEVFLQHLNNKKPYSRILLLIFPCHCTQQYPNKVMKTGSLEMNAAATTLPSVSNQHELMAFFANPKLFNSSREQSPLLFSSCDQGSIFSETPTQNLKP